MGLLSSSVSVMRYKVEGQLKEPITDTIAQALKHNAFTEIEDEAEEKLSGWTSFVHPFSPDFEGSSYMFGTYLVFSLRIDKKSIPSKLVRKHYSIEADKKLAETGREYLSRSERLAIREHVLDVLTLRIPASPNLYDLMWDYEAGMLWFFSTQKSANEELESLFSKSFKLSLIRLFPYTMADLTSGLSDIQRNKIEQLSPTSFAD
ncbi:MAG: recombination-associated protein RdgC [Desulfobacteraceae bacterium]|nr:recombination-associated protein RdgC [Desulfobacteraceae bacterium]